MRSLLNKALLLSFISLLLVSPPYSGEGRFQESRKEAAVLFPVQEGGKWGFIDKTGKVVIEPRFSAVGFFTDGLAWARVGRTWGYIDRTGKFVWKSAD